MSVTTRQAPDAVVFDMDGVLVDSVRIHADAWKETFDKFLADQGRDDRFALPDDYRRYVDGRPRYQGVATFLQSRGIDLPYGDPDDPPGMNTMTAVGNLKNQIFHGLLEDEEVAPLPGVVPLLDSLADEGTPVAVVSSSRNTDHILPPEIAERVEVVLGGRDLDALGIPGKPDPGMFIRGIEELDRTPGEGVVVEDSPAGVLAGRRGGFSLVVGIDPGENRTIQDLSDVSVPGVSALPHSAGAWFDLLSPPPPALESVNRIRRRIGDEVAVLLDLDGSSHRFDLSADSEVYRSAPAADEPANDIQLFIGSDENHLLEVRMHDGVGVVVDGQSDRATWADFRLSDPAEVVTFLTEMAAQDE